jgi:hypothetical protein
LELVSWFAERLCFELVSPPALPPPGPGSSASRREHRPSPVPNKICRGKVVRPESCQGPKQSAGAATSILLWFCSLSSFVKGKTWSVVVRVCRLVTARCFGWRAASGKIEIPPPR